MSDRARQNLLWCFHLLDGMAAAGVRHLVLSPGSRSTPLVLAAERHPRLRLHTLIDERSAGFFALGLARHDQTPAVLVATSGSAPAHWYPAVIEANRSQVPLLLLSADRPPELQDWGANQTIDQTRLFGTQVRAFHDPGPAQADADALRFIRQLGRKAVNQSRWPHPGPVHINLPLREPLVAEDLAIPACSEPDPAFPQPRPALDPAELADLGQRMNGRRGVIVCGPLPADPELAPSLAELSTRLGCPLLADPLSGLRCGGAVQPLSGYDAFLRNRACRDRLRPDWILRLGTPPVSKTLLSYLDRQPQAQQWVVDPSGGWPDPLYRSQRLRTDPARLCTALLQRKIAPAPDGWRTEWDHWERIAHAVVPARTAEAPVSEDGLITDLLDQLPADATLFSSNSLPIRQLDSWCRGRPEPMRIIANRGASGIDGNVSTLLGLAAAGARPLVGLLGDLALLHDCNGLLTAPGLQAVLVVINNGGGGIFGYLPQADLPDFAAHWLTPHGMDLAQLAALHRLPHRRVERQGEFGPALARALATPEVSMIEVMVDREYSQARHQDYWSRLASSPAP